MTLADMQHSQRRRRIRTDLEVKAELIKMYILDGTIDETEGNSILERLWKIIDELDDMDKKYENIRK